MGSSAKLISISERDFAEQESFVEKSGTGIQAREAEGCQPVMSIMANFVEYVRDAAGDHMESDACVKGPLLQGTKPTLH